MIGQPVTRLLAPDRPQEETRMLEVARRGETRNYETVRIRKDSRPVELSLTMSPIRNPAGEIIGISSIARDITEWRRATRELRESQARISALIENAMDAIIVADAGQRVTLSIRRRRRCLACARTRPWAGRSIILFPSDSGAASGPEAAISASWGPRAA